MSVQIDSIVKIYKKDFHMVYGVEVYDSFTGNEVFYPFGDDTQDKFEGLEILREIYNAEDLESEETIINILDKVKDNQCHIFIDGELYEWENIKPIIYDIFDKLNYNEDNMEDEDED